ncbi:hypothetical protein PENTCL1PPCAC_8784 [Pristionchus entomophagus]|uniref:Uncharacterized protein n=1 Tax=Pristionchus entomophagus TaxID=358040 RepID=A0AAV5SZ64_9BILA|nr:hypothetical protein PENTCL1PPCAC_8784 [Pristionchus entomophagus]
MGSADAYLKRRTFLMMGNTPSSESQSNRKRKSSTRLFEKFAQLRNSIIPTLFATTAHGSRDLRITGSTKLMTRFSRISNRGGGSCDYQDRTEMEEGQRHH